MNKIIGKTTGNNNDSLNVKTIPAIYLGIGFDLPDYAGKFRIFFF